MSLPFRIALAQSCPLSAHPGPPALGKQPSPSPFPTLDFNLIRVVEMVERAKSQRAEIVIFPEYFLQGIVNDCRQVSQKSQVRGGVAQARSVVPHLSLGTSRHFPRLTRTNPSHLHHWLHRPSYTTHLFSPCTLSRDLSVQSHPLVI